MDNTKNKNNNISSQQQNAKEPLDKQKSYDKLYTKRNKDKDSREEYEKSLMGRASNKTANDFTKLENDIVDRHNELTGKLIDTAKEANENHWEPSYKKHYDRVYPESEKQVKKEYGDKRKQECLANYERINFLEREILDVDSSNDVKKQETLKELNENLSKELQQKAFNKLQDSVILSNKIRTEYFQSELKKYQSKLKKVDNKFHDISKAVLNVAIQNSRDSDGYQDNNKNNIENASFELSNMVDNLNSQDSRKYTKMILDHHNLHIANNKRYAAATPAATPAAMPAAMPATTSWVRSNNTSAATSWVRSATPATTSGRVVGGSNSPHQSRSSRG